jgi:hypothetical protein
MRNIYLALGLLVTSFIRADAQTGNNQIGIGAEVGIPTGDFSEAFLTGFGTSVKGLYGVGGAGQVTLTLGYTLFKEKEESGVNLKASILRLLAGYRHNLNGLYIEPQVGYGNYGLHVIYMGVKDSDFDSPFTWAAGLGYVLNNLDISARYQSGKLEGPGTAFSFVGLRMGYNLPIGAISK